jgi:hypothetical protein
MQMLVMMLMTVLLQMMALPVAAASLRSRDDDNYDHDLWMIIEK